MALPHYPVQDALPELKRALKERQAAVLTAPPGSGKTTIVPLALVDEPWLAGKEILLLEPRRMAARSAAWRISELSGDELGGLVGYAIRLERKLSARTRITVLTEGLLARRILQDPELEKVGLIIFDEFHERSLQADFGLALALDVQRQLRPDLRILVMSATLQAQGIAAHLGSNTAVVTAEGRLFPVETEFFAVSRDLPIAERVLQGIRRGLTESEGSILAFLPGEGEIRLCEQLLRERYTPASGIDIFPLYAALSRSEQDAALRPSPSGRRKVVLATSIAESSLTIEGITCVVDSGMARISGFSGASGMSHLETIRITRDRADQRRGRAGRLGPGLCIRLWSEEEDRRLLPAATPELLRADLASIVLSCADWGSCERSSLPWYTLPPTDSWKQATELLIKLNALDAKCRITPAGRRLLQLGVHPRLAHAILCAAELGREAFDEACLLAAALSEGGGNAFRAFCNAEHLIHALHTGEGLPGAARKRILELAKAWQRSYGSYVNERTSSVSTGELLAFAYPDRIARRRLQARDLGRYRLRGGRGAALPPDDPLAHSDWLVVAEIDDSQADGTIRLAAPIETSRVEALFENDFEERDVLEWNPRRKRVDAEQRVMLGEIVVRTRPAKSPDPEQLLTYLCEGIRYEGIERLKWTTAATELCARVEFIRRVLPEEALPDFSEQALSDELELWLGPFLYGFTTLEQAAELDLYPALEQRLSGKMSKLAELAPTHFVLPRSGRARIDYCGEMPTAAVRIQEVFGIQRTPRLARGKVPLVLQLLSPARRPVQITSDLESFWKNGYPEVRKDLRGRYPKHQWPEAADLIM